MVDRIAIGTIEGKPRGVADHAALLGCERRAGRGAIRKPLRIEMGSFRSEVAELQGQRRRQRLLQQEIPGLRITHLVKAVNRKGVGDLLRIHGEKTLLNGEEIPSA